MLVYNVDVICVVVDGVIYCSEVVDVVGFVVIVVILMRGAEAVVPRCTGCTFDDERLLVVVLLFVAISVSCC